MGLGHLVNKKFSSAIPTATAVVVEPIDIGDYDKFSLVYQNYNSGIALTDLIVQVAMTPSGTAVDVPPNWYQLSTATLPQPSALGATAVVISPPVDNTYKWLRVLAKAGTTATAGSLAVTVGGFQRA
jgi:hypothetical protein